MAVKKKGLGKGLDSIIPEYEEAAETSKPEEQTRTVLKISEVEPNREQPRRNFNEDALEELADSIRQYGVLQPLLVSKKENYYEIITGERRWRAAKKAGLSEIPVIVKDFSKQEILEISLIENLQRENLNPIEEAMAYERLLSEFHLKQDEVAEKVSKSRTAVTNAVRLLQLDSRVQQMVIDDKLTAGHARTLLGIEDKETQWKIANRVFEEKLSVRELEKLVKKLQRGERPKPEPVNDVAEYAYKAMEERMRDVLGTKVTLRHKPDNKGKIEIEYYSREDLERIYDLLEKCAEKA